MTSGITTLRGGSPVIRTGRLGLLVLCVAVVAVALFAASPAMAARAHVFKFSFGGPGEAAGEMSLETPLKAGGKPGSGVAVSDASHDLFVADTSNRRVDEFTATGAFVMAFGREVNETAVKESRVSEEDVCPAEGHPEDHCQAGTSGSAPGEFEQPAYIAVDNNPASASFGDIYVGDPGDNLISKFDSEGVLIADWGNNGAGATPDGQLNGSPKQLLGGPFDQPLAGIASDPQGNLWAYSKNGTMFHFREDGDWTSTCVAHAGGGADVGGLAISEPEAGRPLAFVLDGADRVIRLEPDANEGDVSEEKECAHPENVTAGSASAAGLGVDSFRGDLYINREGSLLEDIAASCVPNARGCEPSQVFGEAQLSGVTGVAVDPASGELFAADGTSDEIVAFGLALEAMPLSASEIGAGSATLHATVNPVGSALTRCVFEYGETTGYGLSVPCSQSFSSVGEGDSPVEVSAPVTGLGSGRAYHYRLRATNGNGGIFSEDEPFATPTTARVEEVSSSGLTGDSAVLEARVNPEGLPGHYHFEYGPCVTLAACPTSAYPERSPVMPAEDPLLVAGNAVSTVSGHVGGLSAGTTYHYRIVVEDQNGVASPSPEGTFIVGPVGPGCVASRPAEDAFLSDCRAYEMVTPPLKNGALVEAGAFASPPVISDDGSTVLDRSIQCFGAPKSCVGLRAFEGEPFRFTRSTDGWSSEPLAPPATFTSNTMWTYDADSGAVLYSLPGTPPALEQFYVSQPGGALQPIGPVAEHPESVRRITNAPFVTTADASHVLYQAAGLWPSIEGDAPGQEAVYEYSGPAQAKPELVGESGPAGSRHLIGDCGVALGGSKGVPARFGSLSADGRTVFFTVRTCAGVPSNELFEQVEGAAGGHSILVSGDGPESSCNAACRAQPARDAAFQGAAADGSRVFFTDTQQLTDSASQDTHGTDSAFAPGCPETVASSGGCNLYEFECPEHCEETSREHLVDVSAGDSSGRGPQVQGVLAIAPGGEDVYFVARGVLTEGTNRAGQEPVPGGENLYAYAAAGAGAPAHTEFIATLGHDEAERNQWVEGVGFANVTPDGQFLVFTSHEALTADVSRPEGPAQVYRFDADTEELARVSVGAEGFNDNGNDGTGDARIVLAQQGFLAGDGPARANPTMSNDGQFVFFESPIALTPGALNDECVTGNCPPEHTPGVLAENIYEWAADGARISGGTAPCGEPGGCVSLISDGRDRNESNKAHQSASTVELQGVDATGQNVFFWTADQLVGQDTDSQVDLYDARVEGGFPEPSAQAPCGSIEECHPTSSSAPVSEGSLGSQIFTGPGNIFTGPGNLPPTLAKGTSVAPKPKTAAQLRAEKLVKALKACRKSAGKAKRLKCEGAARRVYGPVKKIQATQKRISSGVIHERRSRA
jgi:hypothetical protein